MINMLIITRHAGCLISDEVIAGASNDAPYLLPVMLKRIFVRAPCERSEPSPGSEREADGSAA